MITSRGVLLFILAFVVLPRVPARAQSSPLQFVAVAPCRVADTRITGNPIQSGTAQDFPVQGACGIPSSAAAYSLNVTVVPHGALNYLTVWPAGQTQPVVSTLNSVDGRIKANAAIVGSGAGTGGAVSVYATDTTDVILDIDGYFTASDSSTLAFYPVTPCRVADTRNGQFLPGGQEADFEVSGLCNIPASATGYSLNLTAIPRKPLGYLTVWPAGQTQPYVSTLNSPTGTIVANAAMVGAGAAGKVSVYPTDDTDLIIDIDGYYALPSSQQRGLSLYTLTPCRVVDTRMTTGAFTGTLPVNAVQSPCNIPLLAQALVLNATVVPPGPMEYLTLWPDGQPRPLASTLNAVDGKVTSNLAVTPTLNGFVDGYASDSTQLVLDVFSYFALPSQMSGDYVFTFSGFNNGKPVIMAGSFVADGNGNITSGLLDYNDGTGELPTNNPTPQTIGAGSVYSIAPNGLGTMTLTTNLAVFQFAVAIRNDGSGTLIESDPANQQAFGSGAILSNTPLNQGEEFPLCGSHVSLGLSGFDKSLVTRYVAAGTFQFDPGTCVDAENGIININDGGAVSSPAFSGAFNQLIHSTSRGIAGVVLFPGDRHFYAFYLVSSSDRKTNELVLVSTDPVSQPAPLTLWLARQQATPPTGWDNTYLSGAAVAELNALDTNGALDVTAGLFTGQGVAGHTCTSGINQSPEWDPAQFNYDQNQGGNSTLRQTSNGSYCIDQTTGRVTLTRFNKGPFATPTVFYLVNAGQGFVQGTDPAATSGYLEQQSGSPLTNGSIRGAYVGGTVGPVTAAVTNAASQIFADGGNNITGSANTSGPSGPGQLNVNYTYTVDSTGRTVVQQGGNAIGVLYVVSPQMLVMLPTTTDPNPALTVFAAGGAN